MELINRIQSEYTEGRDYLVQKKLRQVDQMNLFNNLARGEENIASTMLYVIFNRVLSNLYEDKHTITFVPAEDGDQKKTEVLNKLARNDYEEMEKQRLDYDWTWDTLMFGRGYCETIRWDPERKMMKPTIINPLMLQYDPYFSDPQDWRYYSKWKMLSRYQIQNLIKDKVITGISSPDEMPMGIEDYLWTYKLKLDAAKLATPVGDTSGASGNSLYQILEHFTHDDDGNKIVIWTDRDASKILYQKKLDLRDGTKGRSKWPIVAKEVFKEAHTEATLSLVDLLEDKHRALNVLYNLAYIAAKDEANPIYVYRKDLVNDLSQLFQRNIQQHIPVDDVNAIAPLNTKPSLSGSLLQFIGLIKGEANEPAGTGMSFQPTKKGKQTATDSAIQQQLNDMAVSLQAKLISIGEKDFWSHWYQRLKRYAKDTDSKIIALTDVKGVSVETITMGDAKTKYPPRIEVNSKKEAEYKQLVLRRDEMQIFPILGKFLDAGGFKNYLKHIFLPKFGVMDSTIDLVIPKSVDEMKQERENTVLDENTFVPVDPTDDDETHLYVMKEAGKRNAAWWAHYLVHEKNLAAKKKQKEQQDKEQGGGGQSGGQPGGPIPDQMFATQGKAGNPNQVKTPGKKLQSPTMAAVPLQKEGQPNIGQFGPQNGGGGI